MQYSDYPVEILRCQHIRVNGTLCGSPALRRSRFCFFHKRWHDQRVAINSNKRRSRVAFDLPVLEDANSIQVALMQIMRLILAHQIDPKTAGLLLYALQTASVNLRHTNFQPLETKVVINPARVKDTPLGVDPWSPDDDEYQEQCECPEEEEEVDEDEDQECDGQPDACHCAEASVSGHPQAAARDKEDDEDLDARALRLLGLHREIDDETHPITSSPQPSP
jgi:hypothetical protein